jgi:hypothetical protein
MRMNQHIEGNTLALETDKTEIHSDSRETWQQGEQTAHEQSLRTARTHTNSHARTHS